MISKDRKQDIKFIAERENSRKTMKLQKKERWGWRASGYKLGRILITDKGVILKLRGEEMQRKKE